MKFPIIAKLNMGRKGRGIKKFDQKQEAIKFFSQNKFDNLAQEYYPVESDYRVFVVGNEVIGGFERFIVEGEYRSNMHGTPAQKINVDKEMAKIAVTGGSKTSAQQNTIEIAQENKLIDNNNQKIKLI